MRLRVGYVGVLVGDSWFIIGGGDNIGVILEILVLSMIILFWFIEVKVEVFIFVVSEGLSVVVLIDIFLVFGGYNGYFINEVYVYKLGLV